MSTPPSSLALPMVITYFPSDTFTTTTQIPSPPLPGIITITCVSLSPLAVLFVYLVIVAAYDPAESRGYASIFPFTTKDRPEVTLPPRKRLGIALGPRYEVGESSSTAVARPTRGLRADYGFIANMDREIRRDPERDIGYGITDSWDDIVEILQGAPETDGITSAGGDHRRQKQQQWHEADKETSKLIWTSSRDSIGPAKGPAIAWKPPEGGWTVGRRLHTTTTDGCLGIALVLVRRLERVQLQLPLDEWRSLEQTLVCRYMDTEIRRLRAEESTRGRSRLAEALKLSKKEYRLDGRVSEGAWTTKGPAQSDAPREVVAVSSDLREMLYRSFVQYYYLYSILSVRDLKKMAPKRRTTRYNPGATPTPVTDTHTTTSITNAQLQAMIDEGVTAALTARDATRNGDNSHTSGTGARRPMQVARECTYPDF
ncbi:hypothetical protein Tco_1183187 [Tanacetum coccineum]